MRSIGWVVLAETPGHEIVVGAVTKPWEPNVTFRSIPADAYASFNEPDYVKIVWTLRADPIGDTASKYPSGDARGSNRSVSTREVPALLGCSPGIILIRRMMVGPVKAEAERRSREPLLSSARP